MTHAGQIVLFRFPQTDLEHGKLRPALLVSHVPGPFNNWLVCMISSQIHKLIPELDEILLEKDADFAQSGLKVASVIRVGRLAVVEGKLLVGAIGEIDAMRLQRIKLNLVKWLSSKEQARPIENSESKFGGLVGEANDLVTAENTAARWGSGMVAGFSTPAMIGLMETAAFNATKVVLPTTQSTVGIEVNIKHLAATPIGMHVRARAELERVDGRKLFFKVEAWDDVEKIGEGTHARFVVDLDRFEKRFEEKRARK
ncbi:MAG TPA: type II toxin-antitoxin system PemK/MazF family toxin [Anaerolineae bacterium]|nr:type II toxin-antitoxin system PemK/MazF family toxin [Anaerolineae bacterium]